MRNNVVVLTLVSIVSFAACTSSNTYKRYSEEDLIYRYLNTYFKDSIQSSDYKLLCFRTQGVCQSCRKQPIENVLDFVVNNHANLYVLFDEDKRFQKAKDRYGDKIHYLFGNDKEMDKYGIPMSAPVLFTFENNKIVDYEYYDSKW
jgi:hypothetical protein